MPTDEDNEYSNLPLLTDRQLKGISAVASLLIFSVTTTFIGVATALAAYAASWLFGYSFGNCFFAVLGCALFGLIHVSVGRLSEKIDMLGEYIEIVNEHSPLWRMNRTLESMLNQHYDEEEEQEEEYTPPLITVLPKHEESKPKRRRRKRK